MTTPTTNTAPAEAHSTLRAVRSVVAVVVLPLLVGVLGFLLVRSWLPELPDPIATHWGTKGVDGFSARSSAPWPPLAAGIFGPLLAGIGWAVAGRTAFVRRGVAALGLGMTAFMTTIFVGTAAIQRGLADAHAAGSADAWLGWGALAGVVGASIGGFLMPGETLGAAVAHAPVPASAPRAALAPGERAMWSGWASSARTMVLVLALSVAPLVVLAIAGMSWVVLASIGVPLLLLMSAFSAFRVTVGQQGLVVRGALGVPRFHVPLTEVAEAGVTSVSPMRDFGGWGLRGDLKGRFGVILRKGPALEVCRGDGSRFVVTLDGADEAAALLNTLADRTR